MKITSDNMILKTNDPELRPKFRNYHGELTTYALACGYVIECRTDDPDYSLVMGMSHGTYDVYGRIAGERIHKAFSTLRAARKEFKKLRTSIQSAARRMERNQEREEQHVTGKD